MSEQVQSAPLQSVAEGEPPLRTYTQNHPPSRKALPEQFSANDTATKMKILYVNKIQPLGGGGAELRLWEIARTLAARGHDVHIVCGKHLPNLPDEEVRDGVTIHAVQILPEWMFRFHMLSFFLSRYGFYLRSTIPIIREVQRADVVVDVASPIVSFAGPACTRMGKPCVLVLHETFGRQWFKLKGPVTATLGYLAEFVLFSRTYDGYITFSNETRRNLVYHGKRPKHIHLIHPYVGVSRQFRSAPYDAGRRREVVCISRLVKQKNLTSLLHAWARVHEQDQTARLRIIGEGPERQYLAYLAQSLDIADVVSFEGRVPDAQKWELLDQAMLLAHPSLQEGFGIVLLEAMLAGLPIVAYDLPVFRQFVSHGLHGLFAPLADHERLAEYILALLNDEALRTEISRANTEHVGEFEWEQAADREEEVLRAIVSGRRASVER